MTIGSPLPTTTWGNPLGIGTSPFRQLELDLDSSTEFRKIKSRLDDIEKRLAILIPNEDLQKRFPALQEAYDHYKLIEKLVNDQVKKNET
jgi:hypothetical protein